jgi:glyoxylase-like metal-dependent hydrolase (beta-lactamase superfamily II)
MIGAVITICDSEMTEFGILALPESFRTDEIVVYKPFDDLYVLQTRRDIGASIYLLIGDSRALLIDSGWKLSENHLTTVVRRITDKPVELAISHGHIDHVGSANEFDHLYIHPGDRELIPNYKRNVIEVKDGHKFDLGGLEVEVVELLGHTVGSIGFLDTRRRFFTGDAIGTKTCLFQFTKLPLESLLGILRKIQGLQDRWDTIWNGHFGNLNKPLGMDYVLQLYELAESVVRGNGKFVGSPSTEQQEKWHLDYVPYVATSGDLMLIYNNRRVHYV